MKRKLFLCLAAAFCLAGAQPAHAASSPTVWLDGEQMTFEVAPIIQNDRTMVPYRAIFEELGYQVGWDAASRSVTAAKDSTTMKLTIGSKKVTVNGETVTSDAAPVIRQNRTLVPLRLVSEYSGCDVLWDAGTRTVAMYHKQAKNAYSGKAGCVTTDGVTLLADKINEALDLLGTQGYSLTDLSPVGTIELGPVEFVVNGIGYGTAYNVNRPYLPFFSVDMKTGEILCVKNRSTIYDELLLDAAQNQIYCVNRMDLTVSRINPETLESEGLSIPNLGPVKLIHDGLIYFTDYTDDSHRYQTAIYNISDKTLRKIPPLHEGELWSTIVPGGQLVYQNCFYTDANGKRINFLKAYDPAAGAVREIPSSHSIMSFDVTENSILYISSENQGTLYRMTLNGDAPMVLADHLFIPGLEYEGPLNGADLTVIGNTAYFTRHDFSPDYGGYDMTSALVTVPTCGGKPYVLDYWVAMSHRMS